MMSDITPRPMNAERHDVTVTSQARGAPAATAPRLPTSWVMPFSVAKRSGGYQLAQIFSSATNVTATPMPTSVRPAAAISQAGARPKTSEPAPAMNAPTGMMMGGASVSAG